MVWTDPLLELFDTVMGETPGIVESREGVKHLELIRTTWLSRAIGEWPLDRQALAAIISDCNSVLKQLP